MTADAGQIMIEQWGDADDFGHVGGDQFANIGIARAGRATKIKLQVSGDERATWWARAVEVWPDYAGYQTKTDREIPVFVLEPTD